jgi:hypothetical protein
MTCSLYLVVLLTLLLLSLCTIVSLYMMGGDKKHLSAVQRARLYGLAQRAQNSGHDPSTWEALSTHQCNDQGAPEVLELSEIQRLYLPQAILIGVQKGGTTALYEYLDQHPDIAKTKKEMYFLDETLDQLLIKSSSANIPRQVGRNLYHQTLRDGMRQPQSQQQQQQQQHKPMVLDLTPNYMMHSDRVPFRIQCLVPWVKLFVLLRNPIDRARSQYEMKLQMVRPHPKHSIPTFDEYVQNDMDALYELGVLQDWTKVDFEEFWNSDKCWKAWQTYIHSGLNAPVGMGLYALQLKPFLDMLSTVHPADNSSHQKNYFLALDSYDLQHDTDKTFQRVLDFLNLSPMSLKEYPSVNKGRHMHEISKRTMERFQAAVEPFNQKLADLLGEEWRDKWRS